MNKTIDPCEHFSCLFESLCSFCCLDQVKYEACFIMYQHCSYTKTHCVILVVCGDILSLYFQRKVGSCFYFLFFYGWELTQTESNTESVLHQQPLSSGKSSPVWLFLLWTPPLCWQPHVALKQQPRLKASGEKWSRCRILGQCFISFCPRCVTHFIPSKQKGWGFFYLFTYLFQENDHPFFSLLEWRQHGFCKSKFWKWNVERLFTFCSAL